MQSEKIHLEQMIKSLERENKTATSKYGLPLALSTASPHLSFIRDKNARSSLMHESIADLLHVGDGKFLHMSTLQL